MTSRKLDDFQMPSPGDHIWIRHRTYSHHGLFLGLNDDNQNVVMHYSGWVDGFSAGPLQLIELTDFTQSSPLFVRDYKLRPFSNDEVIHRALSRLGEDQYDVHSNNCEHFCTWAITGEVESQQVAWVDAVLGAIHPGLEAASRAIGSKNRPTSVKTAKTRSASLTIARNLAIDMGVKSAARWAAGPYGVAAYVGYRFTKQWLKQRSV